MHRDHHHVAVSVEGFVQQLACSYLRHGYWFYVAGRVPEWKDPAQVDTKLVRKYEIDVSESTRRRRKKLSKANLQYLRFDRFFIILATAGSHHFKQDESGAVRDIRRVPIKFHGYSISYRPGGRTRSGEVDPRWHSHVEIERERYKEIRDELLDLATHRSVKNLVLAFYQLPFEPYAPIRRQMLNLLRAVNRKRKAAGFVLLPNEVLPLRRRIVKPFGRETGSESLDENRRKEQGDRDPQPMVSGGMRIANVAEHHQRENENYELVHNHPPDLSSNCARPVVQPEPR